MQMVKRLMEAECLLGKLLVRYFNGLDCSSELDQEGGCMGKNVSADYSAETQSLC